MIRQLSFILPFLLIFWACNNSQSSKKQLTSISFTVGEEIFTANAANNYTVALPSTVDLKNLTPPKIVVSPKANYQSKDSTDFSEPVKYIVTAENGSKKEYTLKVIRTLSSQKQLISVSFSVGDKTFVANATNKYTTAKLPITTDLTKLTPTLEISDKATYEPKDQTDFSKPVTYTLKAENGTIKKYIVRVTIRKFTFVWTIREGRKRTLPIHKKGKYDFTVDWGDGYRQTITSHKDRAHIYKGIKGKNSATVTIIGKLEGFNFGKVTQSAEHLTSVKEWGNIVLGGGDSHFSGCKNLESFSETDSPDFSKTVSFRSLFKNAKKFNSNISHWNTSTIKHMGAMFYNARKFNNGATTRRPTQPLSLNTSIVTDMSTMFYYATSFNQPLINWNTSKVQNMSGMFWEATSFNQPLNFNTAKIKNMQAMFWKAASFNQNIKNWKVAHLKNKTNACKFFSKGATIFKPENQPIFPVGCN